MTLSKHIVARLTDRQLEGLAQQLQRALTTAGLFGRGDYCNTVGNHIKIGLGNGDERICVRITDPLTGPVKIAGWRELQPNQPVRRKARHESVASTCKRVVERTLDVVQELNERYTDISDYLRSLKLHFVHDYYGADLRFEFGIPGRIRAYVNVRPYGAGWAIWSWAPRCTLPGKNLDQTNGPNGNGRPTLYSNVEDFHKKLHEQMDIARAFVKKGNKK